MDTYEKIHMELLKRLKIFSETYVSNKSNENHINSNFNDSKKQSPEKIDSHKRHKRRFSPDLKKLKKIKLNGNTIISPKHNQRRHHNTNTVLTNNFHGKSQFYEKTIYKSQDKPIKINLVSQKFKIANDFNEKNSNIFLNEKDECLREIILSDEIEEESTDSHPKNKKESIHNLSIIKKNKINYNVNNKQNNMKIVKDDSEKYLSELIEEIK